MSATGLDRGLPGAEAGLADERRMYRLMVSGYATLIPLCVMYIVTAWLSHSAALAVCSVQCPVAIAVQTFALYAMRQTLGHDSFRFPYGAGKLENFAAFLCGALYVPIGLYMTYDTVTRLAHPRDVGYALGMIPVAISFTRMVFLYLAIRRIARETRAPSPMVHSYLLDYRVGMLGDLGVLVAFAVGWSLVHSGLPVLGDRMDPAIGLALALYMVYGGARLIRRNFRALMDLPLPEAQQLQVMKALAVHHRDYEEVGTIYTRSSGKLQVVEIELYFAGGKSLGEIDALSADMERSLADALPGLSFRIIPAAEAA